jgi:hypothetical protein
MKVIEYPCEHPDSEAWAERENVRTILDDLPMQCAVCGKLCIWFGAAPDDDAPAKFGGWYCKPCDAYTETDVELDD